jgi:hypothetical protein
MIVFDLQCSQGHGFEGWFASGEAFERQLASDLVHCPVCDVASENVGRRFPEEARKIHYEEVPHRAIRGVATSDEAKALADEGVDFAPIPPILSRDEH